MKQKGHGLEGQGISAKGAKKADGSWDCEELRRRLSRAEEAAKLRAERARQNCPGARDEGHFAAFHALLRVIEGLRAALKDCDEEPLKVEDPGPDPVSVACIIDSSGQLVERIHYSTCGIPLAYPAYDCDSDGDCDASDIAYIQNLINAGGQPYDRLADGNNDHQVNTADHARATAYFQGTTLGWGVLTATNVASRFGWNGWEFDSTIDLKYHVGSVTVSCELDVTLQQ